MSIKEIEVAYFHKDLNRKSIDSYLTKRYYGFRKLFIWFAIFITTYSLTDLFISQTNHSLTIAIVLGLLLWLFLYVYYRNRLMNEVMNAPIRLRENKMNVSAKGIDSCGPIGIGTVSWNDIIEILEFDDTILLMISPIEYFPVPAKCFPDGLSQPEVVALLTKWKNAA